MERGYVNVIISNSNVNLSSSNQMKQSQKTKSITKIGNQVNVVSSVYASSIERRFSNSSYFSDNLKRQMNDSATGSFEDSMLGLKASKNQRISESRNNEQSLRKVREQTLLYILNFLHNRLFAKYGKQNIKTDNQNFENNQNNIIGKREMYFEYTEEEETSFSSSGTVVTADGRNIDFNFELLMSRSFTQAYYNEEDIYATPNASLVDPLVINLDSNIADLSDQKFYFDIDSDGVMDSISRLGSGSGYLALDINGDGKINDGSELFGTKSGNGFMDLSKYDEDGNGWIDENDSVFNKLMIWCKDENGEDILYHLKDKGVGALCLENVNTNFSLKTLKDNLTNGVVRQTGVFLYENGNVGTMQQIDLAKSRNFTA